MATAYGIALLMLAVAGADVISRILPVRLGEVAWRLGAVGVVTLSLPTLLLALLVASLTAWYLGQRLVLRTLAVVSVAAGVVMLATLPFFALDVLEMRRLVQPEGRPSYHLTMLRAALTVLLSAALVAWLGYASWRTSRSGRGTEGKARTKAKAGKEDRAGGVLVGRQG